MYLDFNVSRYLWDPKNVSRLQCFKVFMGSQECISTSMFQSIYGIPRMYPDFNVSILQVPIWLRNTHPPVLSSRFDVKLIPLLSEHDR